MKLPVDAKNGRKLNLVVNYNLSNIAPSAGFVLPRKKQKKVLWIFTATSWLLGLTLITHASMHWE